MERRQQQRSAAGRHRVTTAEGYSTAAGMRERSARAVVGRSRPHVHRTLHLTAKAYRVIDVPSLSAVFGPVTAARLKAAGYESGRAL